MGTAGELEWRRAKGRAPVSHPGGTSSLEGFAGRRGILKSARRCRAAVSTQLGIARLESEPQIMSRMLASYGCHRSSNQRMHSPLMGVTISLLRRRNPIQPLPKHERLLLTLDNPPEFTNSPKIRRNFVTTATYALRNSAAFVWTLLRSTCSTTACGRCSCSSIRSVLLTRSHARSSASSNRRSTLPTSCFPG